MGLFKFVRCDHERMSEHLGSYWTHILFDVTKFNYLIFSNKGQKFHMGSEPS